MTVKKKKDGGWRGQTWITLLLLFLAKSTERIEGTEGRHDTDVALLLLDRLAFVK